MKTFAKKTMVAVSSLSVLAMMGGAYAYAQSGNAPSGRMPGGPTAGDMSAPILKVGAKGVYVLSGKTLTKYDPITLKKSGSITLPSTGTEGMPGRPSDGATLLVSSALGTEQVILISGDQFLRIDGLTMKATVKSALPQSESRQAPEMGMPPSGAPQGMDENGQGGQGDQGGPGAPPEFGGQSMDSSDGSRQGGPTMGRPQAGGMPGGMMMGGRSGVVTEIRQDKLYILRGGTLTLVSIRDGKTLAQVNLSRAAAPSPDR